ncbi:MAG: TIGR04076 family protein [Bacillota bacterium]|nr:TIGR04076 family protein [Bacillota bacterium]
MPKVFKITIEKVNGFCMYGFNEGDEFKFDGLNTPQGGFCGGAYHSIFPYLTMLNFGGKFPSSTTGEVIATCADQGKVIFKIADISEREEDEMNTFIKIKDIISNMGIEGGELKLQTNLTEDLGLDSTEMVEFLVSVEKTFGVKVSASQLEAGNIGEIVRLVDENAASNN